MRSLFENLRFGTRVLRNSPAYTALCVATLALGIAANTTVFSWVNTLLLHPFGGAKESSQLVAVEALTNGNANRSCQNSYLDFTDYRDRTTLLSGVAVHREEVLTLGDDTDSQPVWGELVSGNYFAVLGIDAAAGRVFSRAEYSDALGSAPVAVISDSLWSNRFRRDSRIVGQTIRVNRRELTVVGIAPPDFRGTMPGLAYDIWIPLTMAPELGVMDDSFVKSRSRRNLYTFARLKAGVSLEQARSEVSALAARLRTMYPKTNQTVTNTLLPLWRSHGAAPELLAEPLRILMGVSVLVLLIVCANVANLVLARSVTRRKEFGIRLALGARGGQLVLQLLTETSLMSIAAAIVAMPLAAWMAEALPSMVPAIGFPVYAGFHLDRSVLAFTALVCAAAAILSGVAPAIFLFRSDVNESLKEGGARGYSGGRHSHRTRSAFVIAEVALAAITVIGAGLFARSFNNVRSVSAGFDRDGVVMGRFFMSGAAHTRDDVQQFALRMRTRAESMPGVSAIAYADFAPLGSTSGPWDDMQPEGYVARPGESMQTNRAEVSPGYFDLLRIPILRGRDFTEQDTRESDPVMIVNQRFAKIYFDGQNPVGRKVRRGGKWYTIVGEARDAKYFQVSEPTLPYYYVPFRQTAGLGTQIYMFVRTPGELTPVMNSLHAAAQSVDANVPLSVMRLREYTEMTQLPQKVAAALLSALGTIALVLAAVGLYSVMEYSVTERVQEIGIRVALGAGRASVLGMIVQRGMILTGVGIALGVVVALMGARVTSTMLVGVSTYDPLTIIGSSVFLAVIALIASYVPAWHAVRVDVVQALRRE